MKLRTSATTLATMLTAMLASGGVPAATGEDYPSRAVRIIATAAAGGNLDIVARITAQYLQDAFHQAFVVENKPGANGIVATQFVVKAVPDGYTLLVVPNSFATNPTLVSKLPYDPIKDLASISLLTTQQNVLVLNPNIPASSVKELIALAKSKPGTLFYGSSGNGSSANLAGELFNSMAGTKITQVPYKGTAQILNDVMSGRIHLSFSSLTTILPHYKAGKLKPLGLTGVKRLPAAPEIPTIAEAGVAGYRAMNWVGMLAPAATPKDIITKLSGEIVRRWGMPEAEARFVKLGAEPRASTPQEMDRFVQDEIKTWAKVIKEAGIRVDLK